MGLIIQTFKGYEHFIPSLRFWILTQVSIKIAYLWNVWPCSLVDRYCHMVSAYRWGLE
jgi:hypothetical protein